MSEPAVERIDVMHLDLPGVICCHRFGDVLVDPGPTRSIDNLIAALGDREPRAVLLTHIHLDHAGGTGALVRRFPEIEVLVHSIGAPHIVDPSRLVASATRVFGEAMDSHWGEVVPVPEANVKALEDGDLAHGLRAVLTPGHSGHHLCFVHEDSGVAVVGDIFGQTAEGESEVLLPTPPPEIDLELWSQSIAKLMAHEPAELGLTHFGVAHDPQLQADLALAEIAHVGRISRTGDREAVLADLAAKLDRMTPAVAAAVSQVSPSIEQLWFGLERYWRKHDEAAAK